MSTIEAVIKRHATLIYFALVFVISWGGGLLILGPGSLPLNPVGAANRWRLSRQLAPTSID